MRYVLYHSDERPSCTNYSCESAKQHMDRRHANLVGPLDKNCRLLLNACSQRADDSLLTSAMPHSNASVMWTCFSILFVPPTLITDSGFDVTGEVFIEYLLKSLAFIMEYLHRTTQVQIGMTHEFSGLSMTGNRNWRSLHCEIQWTHYS